MNIKTIEDARALVGRTFERDGTRRKITECTSAPEMAGVVYITEADRWMSLPGIRQWLSGATEVNDES